MNITDIYNITCSTRWHSWLWHCAKGCGFDSRWCHWDLHFSFNILTIILPAALWPWGWLSLYQKWVPDILPGGKGGRFVGLTTLLPSFTDRLQIWQAQSLGTLRACPDLCRDCFTLLAWIRLSKVLLINIVAVLLGLKEYNEYGK